MWHSEEDIVADLALLNDFGIPGDKEPYKILYSSGRGLKANEKREVQKNFIDSRTGNIINVDNEVLDVNEIGYKSKGRGSLLGNFSRTKLQLQQQLRQARPLGSGDEAIECYYKRHNPAVKSKSSVNSSDFDFGGQSRKITSAKVDYLNAHCGSPKFKQRIIATRNSSLQSNALIASLLSKSEVNPVSKLGTDIEEDKRGGTGKNDSNNNSSSNLNINTGDKNVADLSELGAQEHSVNNLNLDRILKGNKLEKNNSLRESSEEAVQNEHIFSKKTIHTSGAYCKIIYDLRKNQKLAEKETVKEKGIGGRIKADSYTAVGEYNSAKQKKDRDDNYRKLGERLNRLSEIGSTTRRGIYDFSQITKYLSTVKPDSSPEFVRSEGPAATFFINSNDDFPSLPKNSPLND